MEAEREHTLDAISGCLVLEQSRRGYRFGLDALLLATDLPVTSERAVVWELGAGHGAVCLSVSARRPAWSVTALERQPSLLERLERNIARNAEVLGEVELVRADLREHRKVLTPHQADLVLCNPPYFPEGTRRVSDDAERADAHHERHGGLADFVAASCYVLKHRGWLKLILPPWRLVSLMAAIAPRDLRLVSTRFVHAEPGRDAYLMEVVMRRGRAPDARVRPPLFVRGEDGFYTEEVARRVAGAACADPEEGFIESVRAASDKQRGLS